MVLVQYDSSDEESDEQTQADAQSEHQAQRQEQESDKLLSTNVTVPSHSQSAVTATPSTTQPQDVQDGSKESESSHVTGPQLPLSAGPVLGPALGPSRPPDTAPPGPQPPAMPLEEVDMSFLETDSEPPNSPYTAQRTLLRDLTLPAIDISTLDIPPSPPSSPSQASSPAAAQFEALNTKFDEFLRMKRTKGVHFNERLATSSMLRNPSLMDKMLGFVGVEAEFLGPDDVKATEQYMTTLPSELWDPIAFPDWAYKDMLRRAQERGTKERERAKGEPVQFVGGGVVGGPGEDSVVGGLSAPGSRSGTPGVGSGPVSAAATASGGKRRSRFDT